MSENTSDQEPSIEEILASIRQIISDDDEPEGENAEAEPFKDLTPEPEPEPEAVEEPAAEPQPELEPEKEDVLELTEEMMEEPEPVSFDEPEIDMQEVDEPAPQPEAEEGGILSDVATAAALSSISKLTGDMPVNRYEGYEGITVEDIVRQLLNPMLKEWLDGNLPIMVERLVQKELETLARKARDE